jgi:hypothetical protein
MSLGRDGSNRAEFSRPASDIQNPRSRLGHQKPGRCAGNRLRRPMRFRKGLNPFRVNPVEAWDAIVNFVLQVSGHSVAFLAGGLVHRHAVNVRNSFGSARSEIAMGIERAPSALWTFGSSECYAPQFKSAKCRSDRCDLCYFRMATLFVLMNGPL